MSLEELPDLLLAADPRIDPGPPPSFLDEPLLDVNLDLQQILDENYYQIDGPIPSARVTTDGPMPEERGNR